MSSLGINIWTQVDVNIAWNEMSSDVIGGYIDGLLADRRWNKFDTEGQSPLFFMLGGEIPEDRQG